MADRVSASIVIGGTVTRADYTELADIIASEGLSIEWDGEPFAPEQHVIGETLQLYAHEVAWGRFEELEAWCNDNKLPYARWLGAYPCQWGAERVVFTGTDEPTSYPCDEDDHVAIRRDTIDKLGSMDAIAAYFDAADFTVPPLVITDTTDPATA